MGKGISLDLRSRVLAAVGEGGSHRAAPARFGVSAASVIRWRAKKREARFEGQFDLEPARSVFLGETWVSTSMGCSHGRASRGQRLWAGMQHGHWKLITFVAGLTLRGMTAAFVLDRPIDRDGFEAYVERVLAPTCAPAFAIAL